MNVKWIDSNHVDVSATAAEVGMGFDMLRSPVVLTKAAWSCCVAWTDEDSDRQTYQETDARLWDLLFVCGTHIQMNVNQLMQRGRYEFRIQCVPRDGVSTEAITTPLVAQPGTGAHAGRLVIDIRDNRSSPQSPTPPKPHTTKHEHGTITKMLGIAVNDHDAGRITTEHFHSILQAAIDNGDILLNANKPYVPPIIYPLIDEGILHPSKYVREFEERQGAELSAYTKKVRNESQGVGCLLVLALAPLLYSACVMLQRIASQITD